MPRQFLWPAGLWTERLAEAVSPRPPSLDVDKHMYWRVLGKRAKSPDEVEAFCLEFQSLWKTLTLRGFNDLDIWAREGLEEFYKDDESWMKEHLFKPNACKVEWRKLASRANRGIQIVR